MKTTAYIYLPGEILAKEVNNERSDFVSDRQQDAFRPGKNETERDRANSEKERKKKEEKKRSRMTREGRNRKVTFLPVPCSGSHVQVRAK